MATANITTNSILSALGEHLNQLYRDFNRIELLSGTADSKTERDRAIDLSNETQRRIHSTLMQISGHEANSLNDIAVQVRALSYFNTCQTEECDDAGQRLCYSIASLLERTGECTRDQWAGDELLPEKFNMLRSEV